MAIPEQLSLAIIKVANRAKIKVTLLTSVVILIVTIVPTLKLLNIEGFV